MQDQYKKPLSDRFPREGAFIVLKAEEDFCLECKCALVEEEEKTSANIYATNQILQAIGKISSSLYVFLFCYFLIFWPVLRHLSVCL